MSANSSFATAKLGRHYAGSCLNFPLWYYVGMEEQELKKYRELIEKELAKVEAELKTVGRKNPDNPADWEPLPDKMDTLASDDNEVADSIESYEENAGILKQLEIRYNELKKALDRIETKTYGTCAVGKEIIEKERLEANPAATTCKKHIVN